jgi:UDP-N-acetylmuramoyl-L-alanyl-D-glutamate--2,6-diaminopimelate ligase
VETPLSDVVDWLGEDLLDLRGGSGPTGVTGVTISSLRVQRGDLYVAPAGARAHGASFAAGAVADGAVAVLTDPAGAAALDDLAGDRGLDVPVLVVRRPRAVVGGLAARIYGDPAARMRLVAVTGTQGKTTTSWLAEAALTTAGVAAGVVGTVGTRINGTEVKTSLTTPEAPDLHALFAVMVEREVTACAMEVSSHALVMGRVDGVVFDVACFTNLGRDHLDFHADVEEYFAAKASLFTPARSRLALVNIDDAYGRRLAAESQVPVRTYSLRDPDADWRASDIRPERTASTFTVRRLQRGQRAVRGRGAGRGRLRRGDGGRGDGALERGARTARAGRGRTVVPGCRRLRPQAGCRGGCARRAPAADGRAARGRDRGGGRPGPREAADDG